jgi:hypothetical protein
MSHPPANSRITRRNLLRISAVVVPAIALGASLPTTAQASSARLTPPAVRNPRSRVSPNGYVC